MKRILIMLSVVLFAVVSANAQTSFSQTTSNPTGAYVNTGKDTVTSPSILPYYIVVGIQPVITKVAGTVAGTAVLYGSVDGTNWVATGDTFSATDVALQSTIWSKSSPGYTKYRVIFTGSGTMSATASCKFYAKK